MSWGIALFEYLLQVPANRIGYAGGITLAQLKILQEVITLAVFVPFAMLYMGEGFKLELPVGGALCLMGAVYFIFRCASAPSHPRDLRHVHGRARQDRARARPYRHRLRRAGLSAHERPAARLWASRLHEGYDAAQLDQLSGRTSTWSATR